MAEPAFLADTAPAVNDTRWLVLAKLVGAVYNAASSPNPADAPSVHDTRWQLLEKLNRLRAGV